MNYIAYILEPENINQNLLKLLNIDHLDGSFDHIYFKPNGLKEFKKSTESHTIFHEAKNGFIKRFQYRASDVEWENSFLVKLNHSPNFDNRIYWQYEGSEPKIKNRQYPGLPIAHFTDIHDWLAYGYYGNEETFTTGANIGAELGLERTAVRREVLQPCKRSSWPHAHSQEEEMILVLAGCGHVWINGFLYIGEQDAKGDKLYYPLHPYRDDFNKKNESFWEDVTFNQLGEHNGSPKIISNVNTGFCYLKNLEDVDWKTIGYKGSINQVHYLDRDFGRLFGTSRVAFHHVRIIPGHRSSLPHAESLEEEFIFILNGTPIVWIDGHRYQLRPGDSVAFPSGTGMAHTILNESDQDVDMIVLGEKTKKENRCYFPLNPEVKNEIKWIPDKKTKLGSDSPYIGIL